MPPPGSLIASKYQVVRPLGAGGMGVVVEAVHLTLGHRVAVKLVQGVGESKPAMARFLHEARVAAQLPGDHIGRAIDIGRTPQGDAFLVMELLIGRDLQAELDARRRIPVREAVDLILEACEGAAEAHAVGLVHRDLKPANLFLAQRRDGSRLVKVLDFGISKWTLGKGPLMSTTSTLTCSAAGTPAYMAPEQFEIDARIDARCDQHALAVVLYEMLTGVPPFVAESAYSLALLIARRAPRGVRELAPEVPAALEAAILRALSKSPEDRFPDLAAFARAIAPFGGDGATASLRNVTSILAAAAAVKVVTERCAPPSGASGSKRGSARPPSPSTSAIEAPVTLPSRAAPSDRSSCDELLPSQDAHGAAGAPLRLPLRLRWAALGPLAIAVAALGFTALLVDTADPPAVAWSAPSRGSEERSAVPSATPPGTALASTALAPAPPTWVGALPSQAASTWAGALPSQAPPPAVRPETRRASRPAVRGPSRSERIAAPEPAPPAAGGRSAREVFGARR